MLDGNVISRLIFSKNCSADYFRNQYEKNMVDYSICVQRETGVCCYACMTQKERFIMISFKSVIVLKNVKNTSLTQNNLLSNDLPKARDSISLRSTKKHVRSSDLSHRWSHLVSLVDFHIFLLCKVKPGKIYQLTHI